jgi:hypothetical protein
MAGCIICNAETFILVGAIPVCVKCLEHPAAAPPRTEQEIRAVLAKRVIDATVRVSTASEIFNAASQFPSGLPHPDGVQRIKGAASELASARKELVSAYRRLDAFLEAGIMPAELKSDGE